MRPNGSMTVYARVVHCLDSLKELIFFYLIYSWHLIKTEMKQIDVYVGICAVCFWFSGYLDIRLTYCLTLVKVAGKSCFFIIHPP
jgi:hypothetical protein